MEERYWVEESQLVLKMKGLASLNWWDYWSFKIFLFSSEKSSWPNMKRGGCVSGRGSTVSLFLRVRVAQKRSRQLDRGERKLSLRDLLSGTCAVMPTFSSSLFLPRDFFSYSQICSKVKHWGWDWHFLGEWKEGPHPNFEKVKHIHQIFRFHPGPL